MSLSVDTMVFLHQLLGNQTLAIGDPQFRETARVVARALDELETAIEAARATPVAGEAEPLAGTVVDGT